MDGVDGWVGWLTRAEKGEEWTSIGIGTRWHVTYGYGTMEAREGASR